MGEQPSLVTAGEVDDLRLLWTSALENARSGTTKARADAENLLPDSPLRHDLMAYIDNLAFEVQLRRAAYEDVSRRFEMQEGRDRDAASDRLAATNTSLAKSQTTIAKAVAAFTLLQLALAFAQAMKWIK